MRNLLHRPLRLSLLAATLFGLLASALSSQDKGPVRFSERLIADKYGYTFGLAAHDLDRDGDLDLLDGHRGRVGIHVRNVPLARPPFIEVVARHFGLPVLIEDDDRTRAAVDLAVLDVLPPLPQVVGRGLTTLEDDV